MFWFDIPNKFCVGCDGVPNVGAGFALFELNVGTEEPKVKEGFCTLLFDTNKLLDVLLDDDHILSFFIDVPKRPPDCNAGVLFT